MHMCQILFSIICICGQVVKKIDFQNATEAQILTKIKCCRANFPIGLGALDPT